MKTREQIVKELNQNELIDKITSINDPWVNLAIEFYQKYPKYQELEANAIWFILQTIRSKHKSVKVHQFTNGSLYFVGDVMTAKNAPIASIGNWTCKDIWEKDLVNHSKVVDEISWNF